MFTKAVLVMEAVVADKPPPSWLVLSVIRLFSSLKRLLLVNKAPPRPSSAVLLINVVPVTVAVLPKRAPPPFELLPVVTLL